MDPSNEYDFFIKTGDTLPDLILTIRDPDGVAITTFPLGTTAQVRVRLVGDYENLIDDAASLNTTTGQVSRAWEEGDTDRPGPCNAEVSLTFPDGATQTFPTYGFFTILIGESLVET